MDTKKLYNWTAKQSEMNIGILDSKEEEQEAQNNLNALNQKQILDNGQDIFASNKIKDPVIDEPLIQDKRQDVEANIPAPVSVFSMKHSLISEGKYTFLAKDGTFKKAKRTTPSSKYMQPILDKLKDLDTLLEGKFDSKDQNAIHKCFRDTILACENYIANRNPWTAEGKARLAMVKDFQKQIQTESIQFADRVEELVKGDQKLLEGKTWLSILSEVRTEVIENNKDGAEVEIGGAGTSKVYIITKNDSTRYFKENEKVPKRSVFQLLGDRTKTFKKKEDDTSKRRARYLEITNKTLKKLYGDERSVLMALFNDGKEDWELASLLRNWAKLDRNFGEMMDEIEDNMSGLEFAKMTKEEREQTNDQQFLLDTLIEMKKKSNLSMMATDGARIENSAEISKRNVATSRMAKLLGLEKLVAKSDLVNLVVDGKSMQGIAMEEVKGKNATDIQATATANKKESRYSNSAFRQTLNLQVFDIICGQIDRNRSNYLCETQTENRVTFITKIKAIDNDLSFGNLTYNDILKTGKNGEQCLRNIEYKNKLAVPYMDEDLANRILGLKLEELNYTMCDILSKKERNALIDRIKGVQKLIRKTKDQENKLRAKGRSVDSVFIGKDDWPKAYAKYQSKVRNDLLNARDPEKVKDLIEKTSYLDTDLIYQKNF